MPQPVGQFDAELRDKPWLDAAMMIEGWFDYGLPFEHELIPAAQSTPVVLGWEAVYPASTSPLPVPLALPL